VKYGVAGITQPSKAVTRIYSGSVTLSLIEARGWGLERDVPLPRKFFHFLFENGEFLCMPAYTNVEQPQSENVLLNK